MYPSTISAGIQACNGIIISHWLNHLRLVVELSFPVIGTVLPLQVVQPTC